MRSSIWAVLGLLALTSAPAFADKVVLVVPNNEVVVRKHRDRGEERRREQERRDRLAHERAERRERRNRERAERRDHHATVVIEGR